MAAAVLSVLSPASAGAQADTVVRRVIYQSPKDPATAFLWSFFIPGTGQMYAGETAKGLGLFVASEAGFVVAIVGLAQKSVQTQCTQIVKQTDPFWNPYTFTQTTNCESGSSGKSLVIGGVAASLGAWLYSMIDAGPAVRRYNARHGLASLGVVPVYRQTPYGAAIGLSIGEVLP